MESRQTSPQRHPPTGLLIALVALLCGLLIGSWPRLAPRAAAQEKSPVFEYKVLDIDYNSYRKTPQWKEIVKAQGDQEWRAVAPFHELVLSTWAKDGWELVTIQPRKTNSVLFYLRRRQ